jgi:hypothetical protein
MRTMRVPLVRSLLDVFPCTSLWTTELHEMLLIVRTSRSRSISRKLARAWPSPMALPLLERSASIAQALLATYVMGRQGLEAFAGDARPVTDDDPRIEYAP